MGHRGWRPFQTVGLDEKVVVIGGAECSRWRATYPVQFRKAGLPRGRGVSLGGSIPRGYEPSLAAESAAT